jgi:hypothetical protein
MFGCLSCRTRFLFVLREEKASISRAKRRSIDSGAKSICLLRVVQRSMMCYHFKHSSRPCQSVVVMLLYGYSVTLVPTSEIPQTRAISWNHHFHPRRATVTAVTWSPGNPLCPFVLDCEAWSRLIDEDSLKSNSRSLGTGLRLSSWS